MVRALALAGLLFTGVSVSAPVARMGDQIATNLIADNSDDVSSQSLFSELSDSGIDVNDPKYASAKDGQPEFLNLVEWAYSANSMDKGYTLYLYIFNKGRTLWDLSKGATVSMAFLKGDETATDVESYRTYSASYVSKTMDDRFIKFRINGGSDMYGRVESKKRRYLVGSLFLTEKATGKNKTFPMGWEADFTGEAAHDTSSVSTLSGTLSPTRSLRIDAIPVTSTVAQGEIFQASTSTYPQDPSYYEENRLRVLTNLNYFSTLFSLPQSTAEYGELQSVHFQYYKYRTNWIVQASQSEYDKLSYFSGKEINYDNPGKTPSVGFYFNPLFDLDVPSNVDYSRSYDTHTPYERFFNNLADAGHHELRIPGYGLVYNTVDTPGLHDQFISGTQVAEDLYKKKAAYGLPVMNGYLDDKYVYVPSYSENKDFFRYGFNNRVISNADLSNSLPVDLLKRRLLSNFNLFGPDHFVFVIPQVKTNVLIPPNNATVLYLFGKRIYTYSDGYDPIERDWTQYFLDNLKSTDLTAYYHMTGNSPDKLLTLIDSSSYKDDWILSKASKGYQEALSSFLQNKEGQGGKFFYRLTYDLGMSNTYKTMSGNSGWYDGTYNNQTDINLSKTDAIFDFTFIDMTFMDENGKLYTLPVSNHPFNQSTDVENPLAPAKEIPWWVWAIVAVIALVLLAFLGKFIKPVGVVLVKVIQTILWIPYIILVWPIAKLAKKDLPVWPFK